MLHYNHFSDCTESIVSRCTYGFFYLCFNYVALDVQTLSYLPSSFPPWNGIIIEKEQTLASYFARVMNLRNDNCL